MRSRTLLCSVLVFTFVFAGVACAQESGPYKVVKIQVVGGDGGFDYVTADPDGRNRPRGTLRVLGTHPNSTLRESHASHRFQHGQRCAYPDHIGHFGPNRAASCARTAAAATGAVPARRR